MYTYIYWTDICQFSCVVQLCCSVVSDTLQSHGMQHTRLPFYHQLLELTKLMSIESEMQPSHPLLSPSPPTFNLSQHQGLFKWVGSLPQVAKVLEFQLQHQSFQWIFRTDFLRVDWLDLLAVQGNLKSLLQHLSSKASILLHSAFFTVQFSHPYMIPGRKPYLWLYESLSVRNVSAV